MSEKQKLVIMDISGQKGLISPLQASLFHLSGLKATPSNLPRNAEEMTYVRGISTMGGKVSFLLTIRSSALLVNLDGLKNLGKTNDNIN